jgi:hypothetical protein
VRDFIHCPPEVGFNAPLFRVFRLEMGFALVKSAAALLARLL